MTTTDDLGSVMRHDDGRVGLRYERDLPHPPEKVWRALTESQHMTAWMPCDMVGERRAGASIELRLWPAIVDLGHTDGAVLPGTITAWDGNTSTPVPARRSPSATRGRSSAATSTFRTRACPSRRPCETE